MKPRTIIEKIWDNHVVASATGAPALLYIDLHLVHEVTSPQAFDGLRERGLKVRRPDLTIATTDHSTPTTPRDLPIVDQDRRRRKWSRWRRIAATSASACYGLHSDKQGIVHVIGPEQGLTQPGMTMVCGDSHTATHGAFGALAFGIGTSEVEHVLATQCLLQQPSKTFAVRVEGTLKPGVSAKDIILAVIAQIGIGGGTGCVFEYYGLGDSRALDGRAHDGLQHVDRRRRARGIGRAGRHDLSVRRRAGRSLRRARIGMRRWRAGSSFRPMKARRTIAKLTHRREHARADGDVRNQSGHGHSDFGRGSRSGFDVPIRWSGRDARQGPEVHGSAGRASRWRAIR